MFCKKDVDAEIKAIIVITSWYIWKERNKVQIEKKTLDIRSVIERIGLAVGDLYEKNKKRNENGIVNERNEGNLDVLQPS